MREDPRVARLPARRGAMTALRRTAAAIAVALLCTAAARATAVPIAPVADAAMRGDDAVVRALIAQGADVNAAQGDGMTALHWAASRGDAALVRLLVAAGARLDATTRNANYTPLHLAARDGDAAAVKALLAAGAAVNAATTSGGATALHFAAARGDEAIVGALLDGGARVDARESAFSQTPLMWAAANDRVAAIRLLVARGADVKATSRVEDMPAREKADRAALQLRTRRVAALKAAEQPPRPSATAPKAAAHDSTARADSVARPRRAVNDTADRAMSYDEMVGNKGGLTPLLFAVRQGNAQSVTALLDAGADVNQVSAGDHTSPLLMATVNGRFDLARALLARGADVHLASDAGATPLYATINIQWAAKSLYPQPTAQYQQQTTYLELMEALLKAGADPNARLKKHLWYMSYNFDLLGVNTDGATPFWRAAYGTDVPAMRLLVKYGADPTIPTRKPAGRQRGADAPAEGDSAAKDLSGVPPVAVGGPAVYPIHAASGVGYGEGYAANSHVHAPDGWLPSVRYLVEELHADVNARDHNGYTPLHHAAARGDNQLIEYLISKGADVHALSRSGQTVADMANGPVQRIPPFPETVALLEKLGSKNNHKCKSC
ncbi:MAG: ankyrin repeat domain-containing protein [Gemmatimonadetes bacterium]|nr:ankyrin repeat domain-containing protein [Gemmatimonadota bacterium]